MTVGEKINAERIRQGMAITKLSTESMVQESYIYKIINGENDSEEFTSRLLRTLGISAEDDIEAPDPMKDVDALRILKSKMKWSLDDIAIRSGVSAAGVEGWLKRGHKPTGRSYLKLRRFLNNYETFVAKKMTLEEEAAQATELGLSYGTYCVYRDAGSLESYIKRRQLEKKRKVNVIESNIGASNGGRKTRSAEGTRY